METKWIGKNVFQESSTYLLPNGRLIEIADCQLLQRPVRQPGRTFKTRSKFKVKQSLFRVACLLLLLALAGCAGQYDCYTCGRVSCGYCPPKPMPFSTYETCNCTDSIGQAFAASLFTQDEVESVADY